MGCGASSTYAVDSSKLTEIVANLRTKIKCDDVLIMGIKDQNTPGKVCMSGGNIGQDMIDAITKLFQEHCGSSVKCEADKYDAMWDTVWRETVLTSGHSTFSFAKPYFPKGKLFVKLLDTIASFGWALSATPNFGGVESRDKNGAVISTVDWPIFVFYKEKESKFKDGHMFWAVKDSNIPGKLCGSGPISDDLQKDVASALSSFQKDEVKIEKDEYDDDHDVVWRGTQITSGAQVMSFKKSYFPLGKTNHAILAAAYKHGWRAVAAPNFGGQGDSWPCTIFRQLKEPGEAPEVLFAAIKDSNLPGKLCLAGPSAEQLCDALCGTLTKLPDNDKAHSEKDEYDEDYDAVCRDVHITNGMAAFSFKLPYFPRCDTTVAMLNCFAQENFQVVACPNFGGMQDSWPSFILEKREPAAVQMFLAIKDENIPGKVCLGGGGIASDATLAQELLMVLKALSGESVEQTIDDYDKTFDIAFKNTTVTTGHATFTWSKPYWPHGHIVGMLLQVLFNHGWVAEGGPNFGDDGQQWPGIIFRSTKE